MKKEFVLLSLIASSLLCSCGGSKEPIGTKPAPVYQVAFDACGGSYVAPITTSKIEYAPLTSRDGFDFAGWYESKTYVGEAVAFPYAVTSDMTFFAKWNELPEYYTVRFETNGGSYVQDFKGTCIEELPLTTKSGFVFKGWYEKIDMIGKPVSFPYDVKSNMTLYAKWSAIENEPEGENLVNVPLGGVEAKTYWSFQYKEDFLFVDVKVADAFVYYRHDNPGSNDNVEIRFDIGENSITGLNIFETFRLIVDAGGKTIKQVAFTNADYKDFNDADNNIRMGAKSCSVLTSGFNGYEATFEIDYDLFGFTKEEMEGKFRIMPMCRNTNSNSSSYCSYSHITSYNDVWTYITLEKDGTFAAKNPDNFDIMFLGDDRFNKGYWSNALNFLKDKNAYIEYNTDMLYEKEILEDVVRVAFTEKAIAAASRLPKKMVISYGGGEIIYADCELSVIKENIMTIIKACTDLGIDTYFLSILPLTSYPNRIGDIVELNTYFKAQALENENLTIIDSFASFYNGSSIQTSLYKDNFNLNSSGYSVLENDLAAALGF